MGTANHKDGDPYEAVPGLGTVLCNLYEELCTSSSTFAAQLKTKTPDHRKIVWTPEMESALESIKKELLDNVVLDLPDPYKPFVLEVDSSDYAVGGVLNQHNPKGEF